jgi:tetratricopeptide (TPR) repeat protein
MLRASYYLATGDCRNSVDCAERAETYPISAANMELRLYTQVVWSQALLRLGRLEEAMQRAQAALKQIQTTVDRKQRARILTTMGLIALEQKEPSRALNYLNEALQLARELKDLGLETRALNNLAKAEESVNRNYVLARAYYEETYRLARDIGDRNAQSFSLSNLGFVAGVQGDFVLARSYHEQALLVAREIGNRYFETYTLINLSAAAVNQNEAQAALGYAQQAADLARQISERAGEAWAAMYMGYAFLALNEVENAQVCFNRSIEIRRELDQPSLLMEPTAGLAETFLLANDLEAASREVEKIVSFIEGGSTLDGTEEPLRIYYACYRLLEQKQDPRSQQILQTAINLLEAQVSKFHDEHARRLFIENFPWRRALYHAAQN